MNNSKCVFSKWASAFTALNCLKHGRIALAIVVCGLIAGVFSDAAAQPAKRAMSIDDQFRLVVPGTPLISPDGNWVLYSRTTTALSENTRHSSYWLANSQSAAAPQEFLPEGSSSPQWARDSRSIYFFRTVGSGNQRVRALFQQRVDETAAIQRTAPETDTRGTWQLSPDGSFFLIGRTESISSGPGADTDVVFVDEGSNRQVRDYWFNLWRYDLTAGTLTRITQRDWWIYSWDVSSDGQKAVVAARPDNGRNTGWKTELFIVDLSNGAVRQMTKNLAPESTPRWSPDGKFIVFSAVRLDYWENGNGDLWSVDVETGAIRDITPVHKGKFSVPVFSPDSKSLFATGGNGTTRFPVRIDVASGQITPLVRTEGSINVGSWSDDRKTFAYLFQDFTTPLDVYIGNVNVLADRQKRVTDLNPWIREEILLGSVHRVKWRSFDGKAIEGLLYLPPKDNNSRPVLSRAMITHVPCGPGCAWLNGFSVKNHIYAGLGYVQLSPNIRGAFNYDDTFMRANKFDIGGGDYRDIMTGVDAMIARGIADGNSLALDGWSYGAILGGLTLTKTTRFKAASLGAMVSDWIAEYGAGANYDVELWYLGGNPWTNTKHWRERSSLTHADRVRTPTLLHHGDDDDTDSPFQSMNYFAALRKFGTEARFMRYPGEGHDLQQPQNLRLRDRYDIAWIQRYVRGIKSAENPQ